MTTIRTILARAVLRMARALTPADSEARARVSDAIVALGRGGPGAPK